MGASLEYHRIPWREPAAPHVLQVLHEDNDVVGIWPSSFVANSRNSSDFSSRKICQTFCVLKATDLLLWRYRERSQDSNNPSSKKSRSWNSRHCSEEMLFLRDRFGIFTLKSMFWAFHFLLSNGMPSSHLFANFNELPYLFPVFVLPPSPSRLKY